MAYIKDNTTTAVKIKRPINYNKLLEKRGGYWVNLPKYDKPHNRSAKRLGYEFYFKIGEDVLTFPITPDELTIKVGSNNKVVTLINEGDVNLLKSPSLIDVEFEARFPMRQYPYARNYQDFQKYFDKFKDLKENKKSFRFIVARTTMQGRSTWDTDLLVALEEFELKESTDNGDDVIISFKLKQFKEYGVKRLTKPNSGSGGGTTNTPSRSNENKTDFPKEYVVKKGDCLWAIAKKEYGDGTKNKVIYNANKSIIESTANKYRNGKGSSNGWWIYPGTKLTLPKL